MRWTITILFIGFLLFPNMFSQDEQDEVALIIETEETPKQAKKQIEKHYPFVDIVATYDTLFHGIAVKGEAKNIEKITKADFVKAVYPVQTYKAIVLEAPLSEEETGNISFPHTINNTSYTGKGVKVAVVDTGIDDTHPDLRNNVQGGFDLVDLDDDPQETTKEEGIPTYHGTHVAGIIAADGELKGVAPDSDIYAYRALGPGGAGTSIQVIAAMEEAVKEGVDVMNLSLGNSVNGPDYPTSKAVNEAARQGVAVVVANGNTGPENWTVGAPATAINAMSVGAFQPEQKIPFLKDPTSKKEIQLNPVQIAMPWELERDYEISEDVETVQGKIGMKTIDKEDVQQVVKDFQDAGATGLLLEESEESADWLAQIAEAAPTIPVAIISEQDYLYIQKQIQKEQTYFKHITKEQAETIAPFSSNGPVTVNWMMKPDIIAPGVNIISTVPDGYDMLNGTSMATPHIAGAVAVLKQAHPEWSNEQIFGALKTTAQKLEEVDPISQGAGNVQLAEAIDTEVIIKDPLLSFGKTNAFINDRDLTLSIENVSDHEKEFRFDIPKKEKGLTWELPQSFSIGAGEKKEIPISLKVNAMEVDEDILQGWIELDNKDETYSLPYVAVQKEADYPRVSGFTFELDVKDEDYYSYELYAAEEAKEIEVQLYNPDTLVYEGKLGSWDQIDIGMNEGKMKKSNIKQQGYYYALIVVQDLDGEFYNYETEVFIE